MRLLTMTLRKALDLYYRFLCEYRSRPTHDKYVRILEQLARELGTGTRVGAITGADLNRALKAMRKPTHALATHEQYKRTVRTFFNWLVQEGHLAKSPVTYTVREALRDPIDTSKAISEEDIEKVLGVCLNARDTAQVIFHRDSAFRLGGAWNLRVAGIDWQAMKITSVELKNNDDGEVIEEPHTVCMSEPLAAALRLWLADRAKLVAGLPEDRGYVFVNLKTGRRLSYFGLLNALRRLGERAGVDLSAHRLRHAWGVWAANHNVPLPTAQAHLGHKRASTTWKFYYRSSEATLRDAVNRRANGANGSEKTAEEEGEVGEGEA
jgi:integrase